jgi:DNA (cytosine-5)-methyltransferase 1
MKKYKTKKPAINFFREDEKVYGARIEGELPKPKRSFKLIDLFCGAGGMTLGFTEAFGHHFKPIWANDFNKYCVETYNANFGNHCIPGDLVEILSKNADIPEADVVIGGPPCQGFSLLNRNRDDDPRRQLWRPYLEVVEKCKAKVFVIENVPQLLETFEHGEITGMAEKLGFRVVSGKVCAADYGVPQTRIRAVIIGSKIGNPSLLFPPRRTHFNPNGKGRYQNTLDFSGNGDFLSEPEKWRTVRNAISDLPIPKGTEVRDDAPPLDLHFGRTPTAMSVKRYHAIPKEGMNRFDLQKRAPEITPKCWIRKKTGGTDLFGRLWWDKPAVTIRTEFYKPEKGRYLHPEQHRPITHREAARFQSFPDNFNFKGSKIEIAKQIGNAVPPLLAARIADIVYVLLTKG